MYHWWVHCWQLAVISVHCQRMLSNNYPSLQECEGKIIKVKWLIKKSKGITEIAALTPLYIHCTRTHVAVLTWTCINHTGKYLPTTGNTEFNSITNLPDLIHVHKWIKLANNNNGYNNAIPTQFIKDIWKDLILYAQITSCKTSQLFFCFFSEEVYKWIPVSVTFFLRC